MEQTSKGQLQNKAGAMVACLEFIKLNVKSESEFGKVASGANKIKRWYLITHKVVSLLVISSAVIFTLYIILL
jgi:hypothetical protein